MSQLTTSRHARWALLATPLSAVLVLAGCSGAQAPDDTEDPALSGFTLMVPQASDLDDPYEQLAAHYSEETGVEIEVLPYQAESYNNQLTTQLQGGNAADLMVLIPGGGQAVTVTTIAEAASSSLSVRHLLRSSPPDRKACSASTARSTGSPRPWRRPPWCGTGRAARAWGSRSTRPHTKRCSRTAPRPAMGGKTVMVVAGAISFNTGLLAATMSATRVYQQDPDWNEQRNAGDVTFADSGWRDVLEDIVEMNDAGCFQDGVAGGTFDSITQGLGGQTALSAPVPGSAAAQINQGAGLELNVQAFPPAKGQEPYAVVSASYAWAINAAAEDDAKASAQAFLDWAAEPEQAQTFADLSGLIPISGATASTVSTGVRAHRRAHRVRFLHRLPGRDVAEPGGLRRAECRHPGTVHRSEDRRPDPR